MTHHELLANARRYAGAFDPGAAHVIGNAGDVVSDDEIRSLALSQRLLGTEEIVLIHRTGRGAASVVDDGFDGIRESIARIKASPHIRRKDAVRGYLYDVPTGALREVSERAS